MNRKKVFYLLIGIFVIFLILFGFAYFQVLKLPKNLKLAPGQKMILSVNFPLRFYSENQSKNHERTVKTFFKQNLVLNSIQAHRYAIEFKLFGKIPIKEMQVEIVAPPKVIPCGQAIGVVLSTRGVVIVGHVPVTGLDQKKYYPAQNAGLKAGDILLKLNDQPLNHVEEVEEILKKADGSIISLTIKRKGQIITKKIKPVLARKGMEQRYMLGLFIEDPAAGVGTLTFYHPKSGGYGGLGHQISNFGGKNGFTFQQGEIVLASINGIRAGLPGKPGEKIGVFNSSQTAIGTISKNCRFGIYGIINDLATSYIQNGFAQAIPVAYSSEISTGTAEIYTVLNGTNVEKFKVNIIKVYQQRFPKDKGLIIKVTDSRLLKLTGGIIQGMSGSPIIQKGKLVGAVTHVFVNDPSKGYGVLAEWMFEEMQTIKEIREAS